MNSREEGRNSEMIEKMVVSGDYYIQVGDARVEFGGNKVLGGRSWRSNVVKI